MSDLERYQQVRTGLCFSCRKPMTTMARKASEKIITQQKTEICQNKNCPLFIDFSKVQNWEIVPGLSFKP